MNRFAVIAVAAAVMVFAALGVAVADDFPGSIGGATGHPGVMGAQGTVTVNANVQPTLTLTVTTMTVDFGNVYAGTVTAEKYVGVEVKSNTAYTLDRSYGANNVEMGLETDLPNGTAGAKPGASYTDTYTLNPQWSVDPGAISTSVQYTVYQ